ncbi:MAG TPA: hypothetical protein VEK32_09725, partial [Thermodesulfobacteriota bacterium]|nr:hypothetical protein [Thermodesulfobacteriota bacterium]
MGIDQKVMERFGYKQMVRWMIVAAIFVFLGKMVWDHWNQVKGTSFTFEAYPLILSTLIFAFSYFIQIWAWYLITVKLGIALSISDTLKSWFYSQLGKYLPGKVWLLLSRFYFYESKGRSRKAISIALYFETATVIGAACFIFLAVLIFHKEKWSYYSWRQWGWVLPLLLLGFASLHPRVLQKISNWVLVRFKREPLSFSFSYADIL